MDRRGYARTHGRAGVLRADDGLPVQLADRARPAPGTLRTARPATDRAFARATRVAYELPRRRGLEMRHRNHYEGLEDRARRLVQVATGSHVTEWTPIGGDDGHSRH